MEQRPIKLARRIVSGGRVGSFAAGVVVVVVEGERERRACNEAESEGARERVERWRVCG